MRYWEEMDIAETAAAMGCWRGVEDALLLGHAYACRRTCSKGITL